MSNRFIPEEEIWVKSHYYDVPRDTRDFCGDLTGKSILNVGCGEMLTDFGLLNLGPQQVVGLDLDHRVTTHLDDVAQKLRKYGITPPTDYHRRISYHAYA